MESISFKARARTIDHLGREQIADAPTAVSELWKNSYDAYARNVSLNVFDGDVPTAAVTDDGHGMSYDEFVGRWLVIGTDSKLSETVANEADRNGLPERARQGQKGIGRLSCAALGHLALIVTKRIGHPYVAALIDWRLFENPYLLLEDISIPVFRFSEREELLAHLGEMQDTLIGNLWGDPSDADRTKRLEAAWAQFDDLERRQDRASTRQGIEDIVVSDVFSERQLATWGAWSTEVEHGTIVLLADLHFDLEALLIKGGPDAQDDTAVGARERCFQTLSSFTDPFDEAPDIQNEFHYAVDVWHRDERTTFLSDERELDYSNFDMLEHIVDGTVDSHGVFRGRIKAFGEWLEEGQEIEPTGIRIPSRRDTRVGRFEFRVGAFEGTRNKSTLSDADYGFISGQAESYSGLFVYRDDLRVLPFGRPEYDFFEIEKRRTIQAGREFWSHRRMFGSIEISSTENPNLRDKAGREGLIDNLSAKVFREIVQNILKTTARRYFGYDAEERSSKIAKITEENKRRKARAAQEKLAERQRKSFRTRVRRQNGSISQLNERLSHLIDEWKALKENPTEAGIVAFREKLLEVELRLHDLYVGELPAGLESFEQEYADYARMFMSASDKWEILSDSSRRILETLTLSEPEEIFRREREARSAELGRIAQSLRAEGSALLEEARQRTHEVVDGYVGDFGGQMRSLGGEVESGTISIVSALERLDGRFSSARSDIELMLRNLNSTFEALRDNIDLNFVATAGADELAELRAQLSTINSLAQLGITVEIIGHELESLDSIITQGLKDFPHSWKTSRAYKQVVSAHESLTDRLRFLSPLKLSGRQSKEQISGKDIAHDLQTFFGENLERESIDLQVSEAFEKFKIFDRRSRIIPVFLNLANNSRYWLAQNDPPGGRILIDVRDDKVIFADDGPGVEPGDVSNLFTLYFTRRSRGGRGVGLYLCRTNLAAGGHQIWYGVEKGDQLLKGANFVMKFMGGGSDDL